MNPVERYHAELEHLTAPEALKEKLYAIPLLYAVETEPQTEAPENDVDRDKATRGTRILFALPPQWKKYALTAAACFAFGVFATDATGWQVLPRMGSSATDDMMYSSTTSTAGYASADKGAYDLEENATTPTFPTLTDTAAPESAIENKTESGTGETDIATTISEDAMQSRSATAISRKIIYTTDLTLETTAYDDTLTALDAAVEATDGYLEFSEQANNPSRTDERSAYFTYRIPVDGYNAFLAHLGETGNVSYQTESATDVTSQYLDMEARITTLTQQRDRLWALQTEAENLADLLEIETALTDVTYEIESYQSQLNFLADQVSYATVSVQLQEVIEYTVTQPTIWDTVSNTFLRSIGSFVNIVAGILLFILSIWVWIALAVVGVLVYYGIKRKKHNNQNK